MQIDPNAYYLNHEDGPQVRLLGEKQTRAKHRHEGKGCPYIKSGSRVIYTGRDILDTLHAQRIDPTSV